MATQAFSLEPTAASLSPPANSTILVTGGASGIGLETALLLHSLEPTNNIIILDRAPGPHASAPASLTSSPRFFYRQCDITNWTQQRDAFEAGYRKFGAVDAVFVNAGVAEYGDQFFRNEVDERGLLREPDRRVVDIDLHAAADTVRLAVHYMRKKEKDGKGRGGSIVMTASLAGYLASAGAPLYSAAKHGIVGLMRALKNDTATLGIAVSVVAPGITLTPILSGVQPGQTLTDWALAMRKEGVPINDPKEVAMSVVYLMGLGMKGNGAGLLIQAGKYADLEGGIARSRKTWMGEEMLGLFRGGRNAPLFPNKL